MPRTKKQSKPAPQATTHAWYPRKIAAVVCLLLIAVFLLVKLLSFRLLAVPFGITADEAAFGYNAVLLEKTMHDQNGKFMPLFVLSLEGADWRQPVTQYTTAAYFKLFGPSLFNLRMVSIWMFISSILIVGLVLSLLFGWQFAIAGSFVFLMTPTMVMQSHMGLDNIAPVPFTAVWLLSVVAYQKTFQKRYLAVAGVMIGSLFYTYKGMRLFLPVWTITTACYLLFLHWQKAKTITASVVASVKAAAWPIVVFGIFELPFLVILPVLRKMYPGAITGGARASFDSIYVFISTYLSNLDPSYMFVNGDITQYHSTGIHGMLLLASMPLFLIGAYLCIRKKGFWWFVLGSFLLAPSLFGLVGSVHRFSRLLAMVPLYVLICSLAIVELWHYRNKWLGRLTVVIIAILMIANFADFLHYYWYIYPKVSEGVFGGRSNQAYMDMAKIAQQQKRVPYIEAATYTYDSDAGLFYKSAYFTTPPKIYHIGDTLPKNAIVLSADSSIPGLRDLHIPLPEHSLLVPD